MNNTPGFVSLAIEPRQRTLVFGLLSLALLALLFGSTTSAGEAGGPTLFPSPADRFGVCVAWDEPPVISNFPVAQLNAGWYVDFWSYENPAHPAGMDYVHLIRTGEAWYDEDTTRALLDVNVPANPGSVWMIGNEMDRVGIQDGRTPAEYAVIYHELYHYIKRLDPTAKIAIGGIVQPTPIRLLYLDFILQEYQNRYGSKMPVDVWNIHNFILCEVCGWGAGIPPGMDAHASLGRFYGVQDNDRLDIFRQQLLDFRRWMADRGERDKPLIVSEYGILMPKVFGFSDDRVIDFMTGTFDFFLNTTSYDLGYLADGYRLVQRWSWYSLNDYQYDPTTGAGYNGNLFDPDSGAITPVGQAYVDYTANLVVPFVDPAVVAVQASPSSPINVTALVTVTSTATIANHGNTPAQDVTVQFWRGHPDQGGTPLGAPQLISDLPRRFGGIRTAQVAWTDVPAGVHLIYAQVSSGNGSPDTDTSNNLGWTIVAVDAIRRFFPLMLF